MTLKMEQEPQADNNNSQQDSKNETDDSGLCLGGLDNAAAYLPSTMTSPALMVLASTDVNQSGLHVQGPRSFDKEPLHVPYTTSNAFPVRPMFNQNEGYSALQSHVFPQLVNPNLDRQMGFLNPGSTAAFRSMGNEEQIVNGFRGSAFVPAKCLKLETPSNDIQSSSSQHIPSRYHSGDGNGYHGLPSLGGSPVGVKEECTTDKESTGTSPEVGDRLTDTPEGDSADRTTPEEGRILRKAKKRGILTNPSPCCPVCGVTVRPPELLSHFEQEVERLARIKGMKRPSRENTPQGRATPSQQNSKKRDQVINDKGTPQVRWETYQRVRSNRQNRLNASSSSSPFGASHKGKRKRSIEEICPVCNERLCGTSEEIQNHADLCLRKREITESEDENVDIEEESDQYEWAGQSRIRATSLLQGRFSAVGYHVGKHEDDDDQDLNVDGDDTATYGQPQYTEADVVPCSSDEPAEDRERQELRKALLMNETPSQPRFFESSKWNTGGDNSEDGKIANVENSVENENADSPEKVISSLKEKIKDLEEQQQQNSKLKCLICMETYARPVVSVGCWHVYCEECWLRTLGTKKVCPQCSMITSPSDLRRIYL